MAICSYLLTPTPGLEHTVLSTLQEFPEVEVYPADQNNVMIVVTETENDQHQNELDDRIKNIDGIDCLALSFGAMQ